MSVDLCVQLPRQRSPTLQHHQAPPPGPAATRPVAGGARGGYWRRPAPKVRGQTSQLRPVLWAGRGSLPGGCDAGPLVPAPAPPEAPRRHAVLRGAAQK